jgi:hypothetical protein
MTENPNGKKTSQALANARANLKKLEAIEIPDAEPNLNSRGFLVRLFERDEGGSGLSPGGSCRG